MNNRDKQFIIWFVVLILVAVSLLIAVQEANDWADFKQAHHCKIVGKVKSSISYGIGTDGKSATIINPEKTGWQCDDGVTYWR